jgi:hypothetical protein
MTSFIVAGAFTYDIALSTTYIGRTDWGSERAIWSIKRDGMGTLSLELKAADVILTEGTYLVLDHEQSNVVLMVV